MSRSTEMKQSVLLKDRDFIRETRLAGGVRMTHKNSGAVGESTRCLDSRLNEQMALQKLARTRAFRDWYKAECLRLVRDDIPTDSLALKEEALAIVERAIERSLAETASTITWTTNADSARALDGYAKRILTFPGAAPAKA